MNLQVQTWRARNAPRNPREKFTRLENNPGLFAGYETANEYQNPAARMHGTQRTASKLPDPTVSAKRPAYERRRQMEDAKAALQAAANPNVGENRFLSKFDEFNRLVSKYQTDGKMWQKPSQLNERIEEARLIFNYGQWQEWLLTVKSRHGRDFNWFHMDWTRGPSKNRFPQFLETDQARVHSYMITFLDYARCQKNKYQVIYRFFKYKLYIILYNLG